MAPEKLRPKWAREGIGEQVAVFDCPHCGTSNAMHELRSAEATQALLHTGERTVAGLDGEAHLMDTRRRHLVYQCAGCHGDTYILWESWWKKHNGGRRSEAPPLVVEPGSTVLHQYPVGSPVYHETIPSAVRVAAREAELCLAMGASNACGVMVRRAMEALCVDKGALGDVLFDQLEDLKEKHKITPDLWEWAEELRVAGRSGAHPVWDALNRDEAEYVVRLLRDIVRYVYIAPHERNERRLKETKKKRE